MLSITGAALRAIHDTSQPLDRDEQLRKALVAAINAERRLQGTPALLSDDLHPPPELSVTVLARLIKPPGADWYEVEAHLDPRDHPRLAQPTNATENPRTAYLTDSVNASRTYGRDVGLCRVDLGRFGRC
ncbi:hypothetical protein [Kribbella sp. NPDC050470]|uniref:hypothetical protein n=1 Tax=unclassified Kribbella TaxID=2644121 RepID=UPI0037967906